MTGRLPALLLALGSLAAAQTLTNAALSGKYFLRHVEFTTDSNGNVTDARSFTGTAQFSGTGTFTVSGTQNVGIFSANPYSATGTYSVAPSGAVTLTNPQKTSLTINARYGIEALIGSSTESTSNTFDLFIAVPAPASTPAPTAASISGTWYAADLELTSASMAHVRDSFLTITSDGAGNFTSIAARGHAADNNSGALLNQSFTATYSVSSDGTGSLTIPGVVSSSLLYQSSRNLQLSASGNVLIGATPGGHDILIAVKAFSGSGSNSSLASYTWNAGLRADTGGGTASYVGTRRNGSDNLVSSWRLNYLGGTTAINETAASPFTIATDGTGSSGAFKTALGTGGNLMVAASVTPLLDPTGYEISFGVASIALTGTGVYVNPLGVLNSASLAPPLDAISPGEFIAIYGNGFAAAPATATPPYPMTLGGVTVTIGGLPAPLYFVGSGQLNCLVPFGVTGPTATIVVKSGTTTSNTITLPVANTTPGIFALDGTGTHDAALLHLNYSIVNSSSPATKGEIVQMYLTGLGALTTPVADGAGATAADPVKAPVQVFVNGTPATIYYSGLASIPGLYQINFQVPSTLAYSGELPIAILTPDAYNDQATIAVQ